MPACWQRSDRYGLYQARLDRALDALPPLECHCLCLLWRTFPPPLIAAVVGVSESDVRAALARAVSQVVQAVS